MFINFCAIEKNNWRLIKNEELEKSQYELIFGFQIIQLKAKETCSTSFLSRVIVFAGIIIKTFCLLVESFYNNCVSLDFNGSYFLLAFFCEFSLEKV
ncbi:hypothetical protein EAG11_03715 [Flavobacterium sp. 140616W15]|nr:hypothetical protein EAG11_03715 [Flavobacterium sp. 140616W15]